ncbi:serine acetyltransferase [Segatella copri]|uniref:serine O-acetyltransferase n=2 Tax=Segatella copri TaxID=165179 RepID=UPI002FF2D44C
MNFIRNRKFRAGPQTSLEGVICPQNSYKQQEIKVFGRSGGVLFYIASDYYRYFGKRDSIICILFKMLFSLDRGVKFLLWYRLASQKNPLRPLAIVVHKILSLRYCIYFPRQIKAGYGLYLSHSMSIVVHPNTIIGNNCNISQFVNIGSNKGTPAIIGDNVYIGPMTCLVEDVHIGNNVTIGAGSVVTHDIPNNSTAVGSPAKVINLNNPARFIMNKYSN